MKRKSTISAPTYASNIPWEQTPEGKASKARSDMRTLQEAEEIKEDKARHAAAVKMAKDSIEDLKCVISPEYDEPKKVGTAKPKNNDMASFVKSREGKK